ncbi:hypothetical protein [Endozoicomonas euniceicola]|uniref:Uncharacterized protein n=1 Tax=Endozoicomonas euniceicola TaxID=1234143 RepID=A0ABY6GT25_9GAMM|nr:hypothetical protein [Endozoicomonas euniceicola]UYM15211.1 hypothetical protein NX720_20465 [Endozoicomonas euniceicola]
MQPPQRLGEELDAMINQLSVEAGYLVSCKDLIRDKRDVEQVLQRTDPLLQFIPELGARIHAYSVQLASGHAPALEPDWDGRGKIGAEADLCRLQGSIEELNKAIATRDKVSDLEINRLLQQVFDACQAFRQSARQLLDGVNEACHPGSRTLSDHHVSTATERLEPDVVRERTERRTRAENKLTQYLLSPSRLIHCFGQNLSWLCHGAYRLGCYGVDKLGDLLDFVFDPVAGGREMLAGPEAEGAGQAGIVEEMFGAPLRAETHPGVQGFKPILGNRRRLERLPESPRPTASIATEAVPEESGSIPLPPAPRGRRTTFNRQKGPLRHFCAEARRATLGCPAPVSSTLPLPLSGSQLLLGKITSLFEQPAPDLEGFITSEFSELEPLHAFQLIHLQELTTTLKSDQFEQFSQALEVQKERLVNIAAHKAIKEARSFEHLFAGKIRAEDYDPWQSVDLDRYIARIEAHLQAEAERVKVSFYDARQRYQASEGKDLQALLLMRQFQIRGEEIARNLAKEEICQSLLFYAGDQLDAGGVAVQAEAVSERLTRLYFDVDASRELPSVDREINFHTSTLNQLSRHLHKLEQTGCIDSKNPAFDHLAQARAAFEKAVEGVWAEYEGIVHSDTVACRQRILHIVEEQLNKFAELGIEGAGQSDDLRTVRFLLKEGWSDYSWLQLHTAINEAGPWLKKLLYREMGTVKAQALNYAGEMKEFFKQTYAAFRCTNDGEMLLALRETLVKWQQSQPAFYQLFIQHYPEFQINKIARMEIGALRNRVRTIAEKEQSRCDQAELSYKMPEASLMAMVVSLLKHCSRDGLGHQADLQNLSDEHQLPVIQYNLDKLCQERSASGQPKFPLLIELQRAVLQPVETLNIDSLCRQVKQSLNRTTLSEGEYRQLSALYSRLLDDIHRRNEGELFLLDGLRI